METRTQLRGICPVCFAQQALRGGRRLVNHGYRRPQHWHSNVGECNGTDAPHFGTPDGRDYTKALAGRLLVQADEQERRADAVVAGTEQVLERKRVAVGVSMEVVKENPTTLDRTDYATRLRYTAKQMRLAAKDFEKKVTEWTADEPVAVAVEAKAAPLVHLYSKRMGGKACASSMMGAQRGGYNNTEDVAKVTCPKCKDRIARLAAKQNGAAV
jgi:hypothetical protein